jgi:hypothetical protein
MKALASIDEAIQLSSTVSKVPCVRGVKVNSLAFSVTLPPLASILTKHKYAHK